MESSPVVKRSVPVAPLFLTVCLAITGCGASAGYGSAPSDPTSPASPVAQATIVWDAPNTLVNGDCATDIAGYRIRYGTSSGNYSFTETQAANTLDCEDTGITAPACGNITTCSYTLRGLSPGRWYFTVSAFDSSDNESGNSNEVVKTVN